MPRAVSQGESLIINPYDIANLFNNYFSSVADIAKENINQSINQSIICILMIAVTLHTLLSSNKV